MPTICTGTLSIATQDSSAGPRGTVVLLHGWPDDASTWDGVAPALQRAGLRTVVPMLRGFGETRFLDADTPRTGNSGILAMDVVDLMDGLGVEQFAVVGHDWGSNMAEALAVGWPGRVERIAMMSTPPRLGGVKTPAFQQAQRQWYHWFMATARGAQAVRDDPHGFARIQWENWSPPGWFTDATFDRVARSFDNPDWVDVTLHSYRARWNEAPPDPRSAGLERQIRETASLSLPTLYIHGAVDGVNPPSTAKPVPGKFSGPFKSVELRGVGHFPQREAPDAVAGHLLALLAPD